MFGGESNPNQSSYGNRPVGGSGNTGQPPAPGSAQAQLGLSAHQQPAQGHPSALFQASQQMHGSGPSSQHNLNMYGQNGVTNAASQGGSGFAQQVPGGLALGGHSVTNSLLGQDGHSYGLGGLGAGGFQGDQSHLMQQNSINMNQNLVQSLDNALAQDQFKFFVEQYQLHNSEKGNLYTWGSGEMGQLGYSSEVITKMPKDREGYPFQPYPLEIMQLRNKGIYQIAGGDGHTVAVDIKGNVYSWGASACGQLGLQSMKDLPTDVEGYPYQPTPRLIELLLNVKIIQIACGDAHTVALTSEGRLYSWGGGGCGQLGHPDTQCMPKDEDGCPYQPKPKMIQDLKPNEVKEVSCGKAHTVAVLRNGHLYSWGAGACGQLGHPDTQTFPADEDGYPYQPIPRLVNALSKHKLIHASCGDVHTMVLSNQGEIYCFGGGSCGQLGFGNISAMPLDVDSCPFMPVPKKIESLQNQFVIQLACGDSHSMALTREGLIFAWGEATYGQLGLDDTKDLLKNTDSKPYQPFPTKVAALQNKKVVAISCGETHTLALTDSGHLYSFGANGCGQLGQFCCEYEKRRRDSFEEIVLPKIQNMNGDQYSFMSGADSDRSAGDGSVRDEPENESSNKQAAGTYAGDSQNVHMTGTSPLMSPPPLYSTDDYKIDGMQLTPKLVKSLMHRKVIKISSGGVHNICIVEPQPNSIQEDVYRQFMSDLYTDVIFKGFYQTYDESTLAGGASGFNGRSSSNTSAYQGDQFGAQPSQLQGSSHMSQQSLSDNEEMRDGGSAGSGSQSLHHSGNDINLGSQDIRIHQQDSSSLAGSQQQPQNASRLNRKQNEQKNLKKIDDFWKPKSRAGCNVEIQAHMGIIASKSKTLSQFLLENKAAAHAPGKDAALPSTAVTGSSLAAGNGKHKKLVIDFKQQVNYQAFRKIVDYCYLGNINVLNQIADSTEMIEVIKLSSHFGLARLLKAAQSFCQNHMMNFMESSFTCLSLKNVQGPDKKKGPQNQAAGAQNSESRQEESSNLGGLGGSTSAQIVSQSGNPQRERGLQSRGAQQQQSSKKNVPASGQLYANQQQTQVQRIKNKNQFTPQGIMFLPDGKALIMDTEQYKQTIERSFVIDLVDQQLNGEGALDGGLPSGMNPGGNNLQIEDQSLANIPSRNQQKEIIRKPSQANQKRIHRQGQDGHSMHNLASSADNALNSSDQQNLPNESLQNIGVGGLASITEEGTSAQNHRDAYNMMRAGHNNDLQKDFISIFDQKEFSDVTLVVENKQIYCHQVILASRSTYFEAIFTHDFSEKDLRVVDFNESGISYEQLVRLLKHIYSDNVKIESKYIYDLLSLADRYDIQSIKRKCEQIFAQHISVDTLCQIFKYACSFNCERLKETCLLFTEENQQDVLTSAGFEELEREEMIQIVRVGKETKKGSSKGKSNKR